MKRIYKTTLALAVSACCSLASAGVVTFNNFNPDIYTNGDVLNNGAENITVRGQGGFDGAIIDGGSPFSCDIAVCPIGNATNYFAGLNDGGMSFDMSGDGFNLLSVDFAFILPVNALVNFTVGRLVITGDDGTTIFHDFGGQNGNGQYSFTHWDIDPSQVHAFTSVTINACLFDGNGNCVNPAGDQAQFGLDNLTYVPEPGTLSLLGLSLAGMAALRRRKPV